MHESTGKAPFQVLYGFCPEIGSNVGDDALEGKAAESAINRMKTLQAEREELSDQLRRAHEKQKLYYDRKHQKMRFQEKDLVVLAAKNIRQLRPNKKLSDRYLGPFEVLEAVGKHGQAYRLKLDPSFKIHDVFHVSLLEPWHKRPETVAKPPPLIVGGHKEWEVKSI